MLLLLGRENSAPGARYNININDVLLICLARRLDSRVRKSRPFGLLQKTLLQYYIESVAAAAAHSLMVH